MAGCQPVAMPHAQRLRYTPGYLQPPRQASAPQISTHLSLGIPQVHAVLIGWHGERASDSGADKTRPARPAATCVPPLAQPQGREAGRGARGAQPCAHAHSLLTPTGGEDRQVAGGRCAWWGVSVCVTACQATATGLTQPDLAQ